MSNRTSADKKEHELQSGTAWYGTSGPKKRRLPPPEEPRENEGESHGGISR